MKTKHLKAAAAAVSLLIASGPALATNTGLEFLGASPEALDVFQFTCPAGTVSARATVADTLNINNDNARMRVILEKVGQIPAAQADDPTEGGSSSRPAVRFGGRGTYRAMFLKTGSGADDYVGNITCRDIAGVAIDPANIPVLPANPQQDQ